jgi:hypothetical protein
VKLAAVAPALFVLVSLCGSPVPAPGGSITGLAFYDANRNGIHDSCDSPLPHVAVSATASNGKTAQATAGDDGTFRIEHVPSGDDRLTLVPGEGFLWPVTTTADDGSPGPAVHVDELQETAGLEIGSASRTAYAADQVAITGIIFNDANANGVIDRDECGIPYAALEQVEIGQERTTALRPDGTYELLNVTSPAPVSLTINPASSGNGLGAITDWTPTSGASPDSASPCGPSEQPVQRYGPMLYEANMGFTYERNVGTVGGMIFDDTNGNGVRDPDEAGVSGASIYLQPVDSGCGGYVDAYLNSDGNGLFDIANVAPGVYSVALANVYTDADGLLAPAWDPGMTITVRGHNSTSLILPVHHQQGATVRVTTFDDANGNGSWDDGERALEAMSVCLLPPGGYEGGVNNIGGAYPGKDNIPPIKQASPYGPTTCGQTGPDGAVLTGPVLAGEYFLSLGPLFASPFAEIPQRNLNLTEGQQLDLYIPVDVLAPEAQVIPEGSGEPLNFTTCYSDPAWVQPPFEDSYGKTMPYGNEWPPEDVARAMYSHGIYAHSGSLDWYTWATIAGLDEWIMSLPPGCTAPGLSVIFDLVGYEPTRAVSDGTVEQFTLAKRDTGLYAIQLDVSKDDSQRWYLFVDEANQPLARCNSYSLQCEWFN